MDHVASRSSAQLIEKPFTRQALSEMVRKVLDA